MNQYPEEWKKYKSAREYQTLVTKILEEIFGKKIVKAEWDAAAYDIHVSPHKQMYFPRIDIAIGPFNSGWDIDIGFDKTEAMKLHPFFKKLTEQKEMGWNKFSRCFLAIEIVFSGSSKHIFGDLANASLNGSIGFIVALSGTAYGKASRMVRYFQSRSDAEEAPMRNLMIFQDDDFLQFLWELQNPDKTRKLLVDKEYKVSTGGPLSGISFLVRAYAGTLKTDDDLSREYQEKFSMYDFKIDQMVATQDVTLSARRYIVPTTSAFVYETITKGGSTVKIMEILDMATQPKFRNKGIESCILDVFKQIAQRNNCRYIVTELPKDSPKEPLGDQKELFGSKGFRVWQDSRSRFSGWVAKATLQV